ncbi:MAG: 30S ribosomal protein S6 [Bryobacteraceae bacterium]|jgi:small subunit ribosomal protein S6|nr:30S ribosomal protein S6 [Bryobacteraceae bacterium]
MRIYEELFIVRPNATEEEIDQAIEQIRQVVTGAGGTLDKVEKWGVRKLAYRVRKHEDGYYVLVQFSAPPDAVTEIERRLRVSDTVIKYLTVRIDRKLKRLEKKRREREKRAARRPAPAAPAPGAPVAEQVMAKAEAEASE